MIITLTGLNNFGLQQELRKLMSSFVAEHTDLALERYDGEDNDFNTMSQSVAALPFLTLRKMVILREPGKQKTFAEKIEEVLKQVSETTDLIIVEPKLDKRLSYYKTLKKQTDFREFGELDTNGLAAWAVQYAKEQGGNLASSDARFLIDRLGANQQLLKQELDKLLAYEPKITKASMELLTDPVPQSTVFELLDAAFAGNTKKAMALYHEQRQLKVEPQAIIAMIAWQLHVLAVVKTASPRSPETIAKEAKLNPFVVRKTMALARGQSLENIKSQVADLLDMDIKSKTVSMDADEALQNYLIKLSLT
jgi:DNA polymerase-3 subunit delta